ncbi:efflux RND transporter permease subunit [Piscinibacter sp. Jin2]|uniref:Efflux RND transporter permease subunit n=1 Tax=Aquariibacter lacus TaxID=2801332 RepID=A0A9X0XDX1_9BURK|nr:efflux RND transporter permease subunit [Piscinibacter lacus]MBL0719814.1 efflux RND transporter permease subunit [Piscinibacter lacus]
MWIVRYALDRAYTIAVMALLIVLAGVLSARKMSTDILPSVDIPSVNLIWTYPGLSAAEMAGKLTSFSEIAVLNNVDDVLEVRSETTDGIAVVKIDFQPQADIAVALSQVTSVSQTILRRMPPGTTPPLVVRASQSSQPILNLVLGSATLDDAALYDYARLALRSQIQNIPGVRMTLPYGGAARQVMLDLDPAALQRHGLSAADVGAALGAQNLTLPAGALREGERELKISLNASPERAGDFADLPIKRIGERLIRLGEVASVRDGPAVQTNLARLNGDNAVMVSILKLGNASTVDIVRQIRERLPEIRAAAPPGMTIEPVFDQSVFVQAAVDTVAFEGVLVGSLVAAVVLIFIGSLRSTAIVLTSIPLALLASVAGLAATGQTFNLMTLGGLALAIGILVDNALVEIENTNRHIALGETVREAVLKSAKEVVFPEFVSTLCICIVFLPIFLLTGVPAYVFKPMALAVVFAMAASFLLSRTLVPMLAHVLLPGELARRQRKGLNLSERLHHHVEHGLDALRDRYVARLSGAMQRLGPGLVAVILGVATLLALGGYAASQLQREFFPRTDAGLIRVYLRAPTGLRLEETARLFADVQRAIRAELPPGELASVVEVIGAPDAINQAWVDSTVVGSFDGELYLQLKPGPRTPVVETEARLRRLLAERFPHVLVLMRPADTTGLTLAGASPSALDLRIVGRDGPGNRAAARQLAEDLKALDGVEDVALRQVPDLPQIHLEIDRARALQYGITQQQVANAVLAALGSGNTVAPQFWSDTATGTSYPVQLIIPPLAIDSVETLLNTPLRLADNGEPILLRAVATATPRTVPANVSRVTLAPALNVLGNVSTRDLGGVADAVAPHLAEAQAQLKPGNRIEMRGQVQLMQQAYRDLAGGLALAVLLVFLIQAANFQSWLLPLNAMAALPVALAGAAAGLWLTATPLSVPALMGMIMVIGVSTANSVLITSFARDRLDAGDTPRDAALAAAGARLRPVLMTALAMIVGVLPMALGHGEGGEQNAPLGRAVVGGLIFGTFGSLVLVPLLFSRCAMPRWRALQRRGLRPAVEPPPAP